MQAIKRDLTARPNRLMVSVGFTTRTSDTRTALARFILRPRKSICSMRKRNALAGVSTRLVMAGGRRHVQSESLKSSGSSHWRVVNPRLPGPSPGAPGLHKPIPVRATMYEHDEHLKKLVRLQLNSEAVDFRDLEDFIREAVGGVSLAMLAYSEAFETTSDAVKEPREFVVTEKQRDTLFFALHSLEKRVELVWSAWLLAHETWAAETGDSNV